MRGPIGRRGWLVLAGVLALALALRVIFLFQIRDHALYSVQTADPAIYLSQARAILAGSLTPDHAYFHSSPLYPFFLAAVMWVEGESLHVVRVTQALVGCVTVLLVYLLSRATVGERPALISSALAAVYVPLIFFEGEFLEITLVIALLAWALVVLQRWVEQRTALAAGSAGALIALAALGKPNLLLFVPVAAAWVAARAVGRRDAARAAVALVAAACAVILPITIHNYMEEGDLIPVSSNGGVNLYIGNHPGAPGTFTVPPDMRFDLRVASMEVAERATGERLSAGEVSDYWAGRAFEFMREQPGMWLRQTARKFALFWNHYEIPNHYDLNFVADIAPVLRNPLGTFAVVAPLGLAGLAIGFRRRKPVGLLIVFGVAFMLSVLPFFITGRYKLPIVLALLPGAGLAVDRLIVTARSRDWRGFLGLAAVIAALAVPVNVDIIEFSSSQMHNTLGAILARQGDLRTAAIEFEAALRENPSDLSARRNLGLAHLELGRYEEAVEHLSRAVRQHPRYYEARLELGRAYAGLDSLRLARETWSNLLAMHPPPQVASMASELLSRHSMEGQ